MKRKPLPDGMSLCELCENPYPTDDLVLHGNKRICPDCVQYLERGEEATRRGIPYKSKLIAAALCFFFGCIGLHRLYLGQIKQFVAFPLFIVIGLFTAFIYIGFVIWLGIIVFAITDFFSILTDKFTDKYGRELV